MKIGIMLTHHNKKKREFAGDQNFVMVVLFRPVVSYAGVITVTVWELDSIS